MEQPSRVALGEFDHFGPGRPDGRRCLRGLGNLRHSLPRLFPRVARLGEPMLPVGFTGPGPAVPAPGVQQLLGGGRAPDTRGHADSAPAEMGDSG